MLGSERYYFLDYPTQAKSISSGATISTSPPTNTAPIPTSSTGIQQTKQTIYQSDLLAGKSTKNKYQFSSLIIYLRANIIVC